MKAGENRRRRGGTAGQSCYELTNVSLSRRWVVVLVTRSKVTLAPRRTLLVHAMPLCRRVIQTLTHPPHSADAGPLIHIITSDRDCQ